MCGLESFCPAWERSAHIAVGCVIITTCTVSTLSHTGLLRAQEDKNHRTHNNKKKHINLICGQPKWGCVSHQSSGYTEDGEEGSGGGEGRVLAHSRLLPHLHISSSDVIGQWLGHHRLPLLTHTDVTSGEEFIPLKLTGLYYFSK